MSTLIPKKYYWKCCTEYPKVAITKSDVENKRVVRCPFCGKAAPKKEIKIAKRFYETDKIVLRVLIRS